MPMIDADTEQRLRALALDVAADRKRVAKNPDAWATSSLVSAWLAAVDPKTLIALLDTIAELRRERDALHKKLREHVLGCSYKNPEAFNRDEALRGYCIECAHSWNAYEVESHAPTCLAAPRALTKQQDTDEARG